MSVWSDKVTTYSPKVWLSFNSTGVPTDNGSLASSLTLTGSAPTTGVSSPQGSAYTFTGATRYSVSNATGTFDDKIYTIEAIIKQSWQNTSQTPTIFRTQNAGSNSYVLIRTVKSDDPTNPGKLQAYIQGSSGTANFFSSERIDDGEWHHIALVVNDTSQKIYIDGVESGSSSTTLGTVSVDSNTHAKYYAGFQDSPEEDFVGSIDEIVIYDSALGGNEIKALSDLAIYQDHSSIQTNGYQKQIQSLKPTVWYRLDDTSGTPTNYGSHSLTLSTNGTPTANQSGGISKTCYYFGGSAGYASTTAMPTNTFNDKIFTIETWFKLSSTDTAASNYHTLYVGVGSSGQVLYFRIIGGTGTDKGKLSMNWLASGYTTKSMLSSGTFNDNNWHHALLVADGTNIKMYVDNVQVGTTSISTSWPTTMSMDGTTNKVIAWADTNEGIKGYLDEFAIYNKALTTTQIANNYNARYWANYDAETTTSSATSPNATYSAESSTSVTYDSGVFIADTAVVVQPSISLDANLNGGGVSTALADIVNPTIEVFSNPNYLADPATASATSPNATAVGQIFVTYSASPATASALLSANVYYGQTIQDNSYTVSIRQIGETTNTDGKNGFIIGSQWTDSTLQSRNSLLLRNEGGVPAQGTVVKAKFDSAWVTASSSTDSGANNTFNIYVFTEAPADWNTFNYSNLPAKQLISTSRLVDDGSNSQFLLDITAAANDSRAYTYGIFIEHIGTPPYASTIWDRTTYSGSGLDTKLMYILTSDIINKNINADIITASADLVQPTIYVEKYVDFQDGVATATADIVDPVVAIQIAAEITSSPLLASTESTMPAFNSTVEYPHGHFEAFGTMPNVQVFAFGTITYAADPATASALFHMPQFDIGENNSSDTMDASAQFVMPTLIIPRVVDAMVTTASVDMLTPSTNTQLLGVYIAEPMTARAQASNPPAYLDLFGDPWYAKLYAQHSVRHGLPAGYGGAFLKIFEDQNTDITQATPNTVQNQNVFNGIPTLRDLRNNVTYGIAVNSGPENDNRYVAAPAITDYSTAANESRMSVGHFDDWNRKAIRLQNIAFQAKSGLTYSKSDFSMEFSIKTTKANQIIAYGDWLAQTSSQRIKSTFNLVDGKLNYMTYNAFEILHPSSTKPYSETQWAQRFRGQLTGNTRIDDGQWHHVIIQFVEGPEGDDGIVGRVQFWIDGNLDIQRFNQSVYDPDFMGANIEDSTFAPDFYTSAWSIDAPATVAERDIDLHYYDFIKYDPILAEPMTASLTMTSGNTAKGNRPRALMLYWWPTSSGQNQNQITKGFDSAYQTTGYNEFDINMFDANLETIDYVNQPPQQYYGWDVFPVDINGYFVSDLVKESAYGGPSNIKETTLGGAILTTGDALAPKFKINRRGYFRDTLDDTRRYIDLVNDIDLSQFDAIFFKNYPDQSNEIDAFARNEIVDPYFNLRETVIYEKFIKSLRAAVDTGISLMVNNPQLALDLKIIDRIEVVPDLDDISGYQSDQYSPTIVPSEAATLPVGTGSTNNIWDDTYKNNRIRVLNTIDGLTNWKSILLTEAANWNNDDTINYGGPNRQFKGFQYKPNGLSVGDEFFISTFKMGIEPNRNYLATPISNVKAGTPITAFANQYRKGLDLVENPYRNYVTSIAVSPGDVLDGRQVGGKIWVNFTDAINEEDEYVSIDGIHTDWINLAYNENNITLASRDQLLASPDLLETRLANGEITQDKYNVETKWQQNGMYILTQTEQISVQGPSKSDFAGVNEKSVQTVNKRKDGIPSTQDVLVAGQFFAFKYARKYAQLVFVAMSMNTRGFKWIASRVEEIGQTQNHTAMPASATMIEPSIIAEKEITINVQAMLANAIKVPAVGYAGDDVLLVSLPLESSALMTSQVKLISAEPMTASAVFREQLVIRTTAQDQVVVYILHEDPILYLREDIIK